MKLSQLLFASLAVACLVGVAFVRQNAESTSDQMVTAAQNFLDTLNGDQKKEAQFKFNDAERTNWHFIPMQEGDKPTRKGLILQQMNDKQRKATLALLRTGTSSVGYDKATIIMSLEGILAELEKRGRFTRSPDWYFVSIFGKPSKNGKWGWRIEGHHLSLNFTLNNGKVISATPAFFGSNPAVVTKGPKKGLQVLEGCEVLAQKLFNSLDDKQKNVALQDKHFAEIEQGKPRPNVGKAKGLAAAKMNEDQKNTLAKLIRTYTERMPKAVGEQQWDRVEKAGIDRVHFAYTGMKGKKPYTYRVQGPTFVIEFLNVQGDSLGNPANHVHSIWRNLQGDFGFAKK